MFAAVIGVLLIGGTAMAANLGLLTGPTYQDHSYRLSVPRPVLRVTLVPVDETPSTSGSTTVPAPSADTTDDTVDRGPADDNSDDPSDTTTTARQEPAPTETDGGDRADDDSDDADDESDGDSDDGSHPSPSAGSGQRIDGRPEGRSVDGAGSLLRGDDGRLDDD